MNVDVKVPEEVIRRYAYKAKKNVGEARILYSRLSEFIDRAYYEVCSPDFELDEAWHEFILHTKDYINYCEARFGRLIHHVPTSPVSCESEGDEVDDGRCSTGFSKLADVTVKCQSCSSDCRSAGD